MPYTEYIDENAVFGAPVDFSSASDHANFDQLDFGNDTLFSNLTPYYYTEADDEFVEELSRFNQFWESLLNVLEPCEIALLAFGFVGNLLAFITLLRSKRMYTPSFLYHRALVGADLLFCTNFFINLAIDRLASVECKQHIFRYRLAAMYSATVNPLVNSFCSYALSYATIAVTLDRLIALSWFRSYQAWNRRHIAKMVITIAVFLSITVHSWTTFVQNTVIEYRLDKDANDTSLIWQPCWTDQVVYHWVKRDHLGEAFNTASNVKRIYNAVFRIAYPLILASLTLGVIWGLIRRGRRKRRLRRGSTLGAAELPSNATWARHISPAARRRHRCEQALFLLTISVLILAFLQVASSEGRRILQFTFPAAEIIRTKVDNAKLPMDERLANFRWVLYAHQATRALANFFTVVERSAICFLYVATNKLFRGELILMLTSIWACCARNSLMEFRRRFDSDTRTLRATSTVLEDRKKSEVGFYGKKASMNLMVRKLSDKRKESAVSLLLFGKL